MFQLYNNIQTDFPGQIFLELFQFKTLSLFWDTLYKTGNSKIILLKNPKDQFALYHCTYELLEMIQRLRIKGPRQMSDTWHLKVGLVSNLTPNTRLIQLPFRR